MTRTHHYTTSIKWTGNLGTGTQNYRSYYRNYEINAAGKQQSVKGSSDPSFRGDPSRYNPEELFVASLSACHMLWYLHLAAASGITVLEYLDRAEGNMTETEDGGGHFTSVTLHPVIKIAESDRIADAYTLHEAAGKKCFIANSVRVPITYAGTISAD